MSDQRPNSDELYGLLDRLFDERLDSAGVKRLARMLAGNQEAQRLYVAELNLRANLAWDLGMQGASQGDWQPGMDDLPVAGGGQKEEDARRDAENDRLPIGETFVGTVPVVPPSSFMVCHFGGFAGALLSYVVAAIQGVRAVSPWSNSWSSSRSSGF
jgi:hypothetical protein